MLPGTQLGLLAGESYTGTIVNRLVGDLGERAASCSYVDGLVTGCIDYGSGFVLPGMIMTHECRSYENGAEQVPGGVGAFGCFVSGAL